jgi:hypothetical protein
LKDLCLGLKLAIIQSNLIRKITSRQVNEPKPFLP